MNLGRTVRQTRKRKLHIAKGENLMKRCDSPSHARYKQENVSFEEYTQGRSIWGIIYYSQRKNWNIVTQLIKGGDPLFLIPIKHKGQFIPSLEGWLINHHSWLRWNKSLIHPSIINPSRNQASINQQDQAKNHQITSITTSSWDYENK